MTKLQAVVLAAVLVAVFTCGEMARMLRAVQKWQNLAPCKLIRTYKSERRQSVFFTFLPYV